MTKLSGISRPFPKLHYEIRALLYLPIVGKVHPIIGLQDLGSVEFYNNKPSGIHYLKKCFYLNKKRGPGDRIGSATMQKKGLVNNKANMQNPERNRSLTASV